jgi:hypothetical protein
LGQIEYIRLQDIPKPVYVSPATMQRLQSVFVQHDSLEGHDDMATDKVTFSTMVFEREFAQRMPSMVFKKTRVIVPGLGHLTCWVREDEY